MRLNEEARKRQNRELEDNREEELRQAYGLMAQHILGGYFKRQRKTSWNLKRMKVIQIIGISLGMLAVQNAHLYLKEIWQEHLKG